MLFKDIALQLSNPTIVSVIERFIPLSRITGIFFFDMNQHKNYLQWTFYLKLVVFTPLFSIVQTIYRKFYFHITLKLSLSFIKCVYMCWIFIYWLLNIKFLCFYIIIVTCNYSHTLPICVKYNRRLTSEKDVAQTQSVTVVIIKRLQGMFDMRTGQLMDLAVWVTSN